MNTTTILTINKIVDRIAEPIFANEFRASGISGETYEKLHTTNIVNMKVALALWLSCAYSGWDENHANEIINYFDVFLDKVRLTDLIRTLVSCDSIITSREDVTMPVSDNQYLAVPSLTHVKAFMCYEMQFAEHWRSARTFLLFLKRFTFLKDPRFLEDSYKSFLDNEQKCKVTNETIECKEAEFKLGNGTVITLSEYMNEVKNILHEVYKDYVSPWPGLANCMAYSSGMFPQLSKYNQEHATNLKTNRFVKRLVAAANDATFCYTDGVPAPYQEVSYGAGWTWIPDDSLSHIWIDFTRHIILGPKSHLNDKQLREVNYAFLEKGLSLFPLGQIDVPDDWDLPFEDLVLTPAMLPGIKQLNIDNKWMVDDGCTYIIAVPKDFKSARIVGEESPDRAQWMSAVAYMMSICRRSSILRKAVTLEDADDSRRMAASLLIATIDLHAASDLNALKVAELLLPNSVFSDIARYRSKTFKFQGSETIMTMEKFLTMGSPACMEYQSTLYAAICLAALNLLYRYDIITNRERQDMKKLIKVHGDDQIVHVCCVPLITWFEEQIGLIINWDKTHFEPDDPYREACGAHWLLSEDDEHQYAVDISTVFWPRRGKEVNSDATLEQLLCHIQHNIFTMGICPTMNEYIREFLATRTSVCESKPEESDGFWSERPIITTAPAVGRESFDWHYNEMALKTASKAVNVTNTFYPSEVEMYQYEEALKGVGRVTEEIPMPDGSTYRFTFSTPHTTKVGTSDTKSERIRIGLN